MDPPATEKTLSQAAVRIGASRPSSASRAEAVEPMLAITQRIAIDEREIVEVFRRPGGSGGQNVNKVATRVQLRFDEAHSRSVDERTHARLRAIAGRGSDGGRSANDFPAALPHATTQSRRPYQRLIDGGIPSTKRRSKARPRTNQAPAPTHRASNWLRVVAIQRPNPLIRNFP